MRRAQPPCPRAPLDAFAARGQQPGLVPERGSGGRRGRRHPVHGRRLHHIALHGQPQHQPGGPVAQRGTQRDMQPVQPQAVAVVGPFGERPPGHKHSVSAVLAVPAVLVVLMPGVPVGEQPGPPGPQRAGRPVGRLDRHPRPRARHRVEQPVQPLRPPGVGPPRHHQQIGGGRSLRQRPPGPAQLPLHGQPAPRAAGHRHQENGRPGQRPPPYRRGQVHRNAPSRQA
ncbi:hypothetical protein [Streptomyces litchfieldiae]|uniref:Uncharacterized protein n=1 Tax=Streptomyces litchfieldiae TaxID=3075543 RepID=A0ABU2MS39_9ACTN|nr:hypothetical protein [Streptomyces sp. DSM 44938]MDT0344426.1 hypothetical protein [Streptomyces sp. DSM 44938]